MKKIDTEQYLLYRRWFARSLDIIWKIPDELRKTADPIWELSKTESINPSKAYKSLMMGISDTVGMSEDLPPEEVKRIDDFFETVQNFVCGS